MSKLPQVSKGRKPEDFLLECSSSSKTTQPLSSQKSKNPSISSNPFTVLGTLPSLSKTPATNYKNALKPDTVPGSGKLPEINNRKIHYIPKNTVIHVAEFEDEWAKYPSLDECLSRIFPPFLKDDDPFNFLDHKYQVLNMFYFIPQNLFQSRMWYESILKVTKSAIISHTPNKPNTHWIDFSKIKILKVLTLSDWNQQPWETKILSLKNGQKSQFSYQDYMKAWYNVLYFRPSSHSWFILFDQNCPDVFPKWFQSWWLYFGATEDILSSRVSEGFNLFKNKGIKFTPNENLLFQYFRTFKVAWIFCWDFEIYPTSTDSFSFQRIVRRCKIKWWEKFNDSNACSKAVQSWIDQQIKVKTETSSSQNDFLTEKSKIMAQMAQCSDPEVFAVLAQKAASMAKAESSRGSAPASEVGSDPDPNFEDDNEDDCLGVDVDLFEI
ncbi:Retrotransposable element Tf2 [Abeliophyllum distichum]|uniref:Retrotransposable element Tf2 n=1 Tax=Abeliophyllum distichum TaxID=126358 RepID=A0ABD1W0H9_9LAMI